MSSPVRYSSILPNFFFVVSRYYMRELLFHKQLEGRRGLKIRLFYELFFYKHYNSLIGRQEWSGNGTRPLNLEIG